MTSRTFRILVLLPALLVIPASWWIARHGVGPFPLAKWLSVACFSLGGVVWILPRGQVSRWRLALLSIVAVVVGLVALGVLPIALMIAAVVTSIGSSLLWSPRPRPPKEGHP
jgi:hypothetical protein